MGAVVADNSPVAAVDIEVEPVVSVVADTEIAALALEAIQTNRFPHAGFALGQPLYHWMQSVHMSRGHRYGYD
jgi:hypothetical protein